MRPPRPLPSLAPILGDRAEEITQAVGEDAYRNYLISAQNQYEPWEKTSFHAAGKGLDPELAWALIKAQRTFNARPLPLTDERGRPLRFWLTDVAQREIMSVDQELAGQFVRSTSRAVTGEQRSQYIFNSVMEEAIASSQLEGAAVTRKDAKRILRKGLKPRNEGEQMVVNNYRAMQFIRENLTTKLTERFIHQLHHILTENTMPPEEIGRWRKPDEDVRVVDERDDEVMHEPPPAAELPDRLENLIAFANREMDQDKMFIHPLVQAIALHFQFGYEHPYCDGNGRVARALFYWSVLRRGYWLFEFLPLSLVIKRSAVQYTKSYIYTEQDGFDLNYFLAYQLRVIGRARSDLRDYLRREEAKRREADHTVAADDRLNARQRMVLHELKQSHDPTITIAEHEGRAVVTYPTARKDLLDLVEAGYLSKEQRGKKFVFQLKPSGE